MQKVKSLVNKFSNILLLPSPDLEQDSFPAILALFFSLRKLGKNVNLKVKDVPENFKPLVREESLGADCLIFIRERGCKVSQIFYEKTGEELKLYLKTNQGKLKKENVRFKSLSSNYLLITLGTENLDGAGALSGEEPQELINIGKEPAAILEAAKTINQELTRESFDLFGRSLEKLRFFQAENLGLVVLKEDDFRATDSSPKELSFTLENLIAPIFSFQNLLCLWESKNSPLLSQGVFYSPNRKLVEEIGGRFQGEKKGNGILFRIENRDIEEVKDDILENL